jgi:hypothetical protein
MIRASPRSSCAFWGVDFGTLLRVFDLVNWDRERARVPLVPITGLLNPGFSRVCYETRGWKIKKAVFGNSGHRFLL